LRCEGEFPKFGFRGHNAIDPKTGRNCEDIVPLFRSIEWLSDEERRKTTEGNAGRVFSPLFFEGHDQSDFLSHTATEKAAEHRQSNRLGLQDLRQRTAKDPKDTTTMFALGYVYMIQMDYDLSFIAEVYLTL
jgi:hypothetical protein